MASTKLKVASLHNRQGRKAADEPQLVSRHRVRDAIQSQILGGVFSPGEKLVQQTLAKSLGVAQSVIREALFELGASGLVETVDNRGIFVADLCYERLLESFEVREVLEGLAARLACDRMTRVQMRELCALADAFFNLGNKSRGSKAAGVADRSFHEQIIRMSGNRMLIRVAENYRVFGKVLHGLRPIQLIHKEHLQIIDAIEAGKGDDAERFSREHIRRAQVFVEKKVADGTFVARWI